MTVFRFLIFHKASDHPYKANEIFDSTFCCLVAKIYFLQDHKNGMIVMTNNKGDHFQSLITSSTVHVFHYFFYKHSNVFTDASCFQTFDGPTMWR